MFPPALSGIDGSKAGRLIEIIQELSLARSLESVMAIVRTAARQLTGADGATFVLRDGGNCYYADEDAISPLWKGRRFPLTACISGWAMLNKQSVAIEDIYLDARIPHDAYRPTF
ncbi:MAG: GAF domain-containing protein, partial [Archangium sp.]|nr:GAF domain-containing protein [Archangium sp.]